MSKFAGCPGGTRAYSGRSGKTGNETAGVTFCPTGELEKLLLSTNCKQFSGGL